MSWYGTAASTVLVKTRSPATICEGFISWTARRAVLANLYKHVKKNLAGDHKSKVILLRTFNIFQYYHIHRSLVPKKTIVKGNSLPSKFVRILHLTKNLWHVLIHAHTVASNLSPVKGSFALHWHWVSIGPAACRISLLMGVDKASKELRQIGQRLAASGVTCRLKCWDGVGGVICCQYQ